MSELWTQLAHYRQVKVLPDGLRLLLRPLGQDDADTLADLFARAAPEDLERFRSDPTDRQVVEGWVRGMAEEFPEPVCIVRLGEKTSSRR